jgi:ethanolamine ammonia-lyase small subunit
MSAPAPPDPWSRLRALTPARIALGRSGSALPTRAVLGFALDHARARDAVHLTFDSAALAARIEALGHKTVTVTSAAADRATYLRRPDLGRRLSGESQALLARRAAPAPADLAIVIGDGLSAAAVSAHALPLLQALAEPTRQAGWRLAPIVLAHQARVALGDEIGALLGARMVVMLIGERPGLSSPDSLGAYLTFDPRPGRTDAERNCISNIRPAGLSYEAAAFTLAWHVREALRRGLTGVGLKDESDLEQLAGIGGPARRLD